MRTTKKWGALLLAGMPGMVLVLGMMVVGCSSAPKTFVRGSSGDTTILLRDGLEYERAFREIAFVLNRHGFDSDTLQPEVGYIRTRWARTTWTNSNIDAYRVRIVCNFNPARTQLIVKAEAEYLIKRVWVQGYDTRAIADIRNDLNMAVGN
ncbi:MAG: hypothetical protein LBQ35_08180 [Spirochaetaceae bacterium]|nr:hypothetical protein [Spirochaetaceae bacterium]